MSGIETILLVAGATASAYGSLVSAQATAAAGEYNAKVAERDIFVEEQNRKTMFEQARIDAEDKRRNNRRTLASLRAAYGASGLEMAGSPLDVLEDTAIEQELDARRIEFEGRVRGREGALRMLGLEEGATLSRLEGRYGAAAGRYGAVGAGLSGVGSALARTG